MLLETTGNKSLEVKLGILFQTVQQGVSLIELSKPY